MIRTDMKIKAMKDNNAMRDHNSVILANEEAENAVGDYDSVIPSSKKQKKKVDNENRHIKVIEEGKIKGSKAKDIASDYNRGIPATQEAENAVGDLKVENK